MIISAPMSRALTCNDNFSTHVEGPDHRSSPVVGIHGGNSGGEGLTREHLHDVLTSKVVPTQQIPIKIQHPNITSNFARIFLCNSTQRLLVT